MADKDNNILGKLALGDTLDNNFHPSDVLNGFNTNDAFNAIKEVDSAVATLNNAERTTRNTEETLAQGVKDVGKGVAMGAGGLLIAGALGVDAVTGTNIAPTVASGVNSLGEAMDGLDDYKRRANQPIAQAKAQEIARRNYEKYGDTARGALANFGDTLFNMNGEDAFQITGEGVGSLVVPGGAMRVGGAVARGVSSVGNRITGNVAKEVASKSASKVDNAVEALTNPSILSKFGNKKELAVMSLIGGMEGGSQAGEFITRVMDTPYDTLYGSSKQFRDLISQGYTEDEARKAVAKSGALQVLMEVGGTAMVLGKAVAKFESAPFVKGSLGKSAGNMAREGVEETAQSSAGAYLTNTNVQELVDKDQKIWEGVGEQGAMGLVGGITSAGVVQAPSMAITGTVAGSKAVANKAMSAFDKAFPEKEQVSTTVKSPTTKAEADTLAENLRGKSIDEAIEYAGIKNPRAFGRSREQYANMTTDTSREGIVKVAKVSAITDLMSFDMPTDKVKEFAPNLTEEDISSLDSLDEKGNVNPFEVFMTSLNKLHADTTLDEATKASESQRLNEIMGEIYATKVEPFKDFFTSFTEELPLNMNTPEGRALSYKLSVFTNNDPEGLQGIFEEAKNAYLQGKDSMMQNNPEAFVEKHIDIDSILSAPTPNKATVTSTIADIDKVLKYLDSSSTTNNSALSNQLKAMREILSKYADTSSKAENDIFNNDTLTDLENGQDNSTGRARSVRQFLNDIRASRNNPQALQENLEDFGKFVQHLQNKANAVNASAEGYVPTASDVSGKPTKGKSLQAGYRALNRETRQHDLEDTISVHLHSPNSVALAQNIIKNANDVTEIYNLAKDAFAPGNSAQTFEKITPHTSLGMVETETSTIEEPNTVPATVVEDKAESEDINTVLPVETEIIQENVEEPTTDTGTTTTPPVAEEQVEEQKQLPTTEPETVNTNQEVNENTSEELTEEDDLDDYDFNMDTVEDIEENIDDYFIEGTEFTQEDYEAYMDTIQEEANAIEHLSDAMENETIEIPQDKHNDMAIKAFMGSEAFELPDLRKEVGNEDVKAKLENVFGTFFTNLGLNNNVIYDIFTRSVKGKEGKREVKFSKKDMRESFRTFARLAELLKAKGYLNTETTLKDIDLTDGSVGTYLLFKSFNQSLSERGRKILAERMNTKSAKSRNVLNNSLVHATKEGSKVHYNTIVEGLDFRTDSITPAMLAKSPFNAFWQFVGSGITYNVVANKGGKKQLHKHIKDIKKLTAKGIETVTANVQEAINKALTERERFGTQNKTIKEYLNDAKNGNVPFGNSILKHYRYRTLNLAEEVNGTLVPNKRLIEAYVMASVDTIFSEMSTVPESVEDTFTMEELEAFHERSKHLDEENMTEEEIEALRRDQNKAIRSERAMREIIPINQMMSNVARKALTILGMQYNRDEPEGTTYGTSKSIASDVLDAIQSLTLEGSNINVLEKSFEEFDVRDNKGNFKKDKQGNKIKAKKLAGYVINGYPIEMLQGENASRANIYSAGADFYTNSITLANTPAIRVTPTIATTRDNVRNSYNLKLRTGDVHDLNRLNEIPKKVNDFMLNQFNTDEAVNNLAIWKNPDLEETIKENFSKGNTIKLISDRSKYNMINESIEYAKQAKAVVEAETERLGTEVNLYTDYGKGGESRYHAEGNMSGQTNKEIREILSPNKSTIDFSKGGIVSDTYFAGLAQGIGLKVNNKVRSEVKEECEKKINDVFDKDIKVSKVDDSKKTVTLNPWNAIREHIKNGTSVLSDTQLMKAIIEANTFTDSKGKEKSHIDTTTVALHNLLDYARYVEATDAERKNFTTFTYLEVDGVTKGVGDSIAIFTDNINNVSDKSERTGTVYSDDLSEFTERVYRTEDSKGNPILDIYGTGAQNYKNITQKYYNKGAPAFKKLFKGVLKHPNESIKITDNVIFNDDGMVSPLSTKEGREMVFGAFTNLLEEFDIGVSFEDDGIHISRNFAKSPVMVINYSAGASSVGNSIANLMYDELLTRIDNVAKKHQTPGKKIDKTKTGTEEAILQTFFSNKESLEANLNKFKSIGVSIALLENTQYIMDGNKPLRDSNGDTYLHVLSHKPFETDVFKKLFEEVFVDPSNAKAFYLKGGNNKFTVASKEVFGVPLIEAVSSISPNSFENMRKVTSVINATEKLHKVILNNRIKQKIDEITNPKNKGSESYDPSRSKYSGLSEKEYLQIARDLRTEYGILSPGNIRMDSFVRRPGELESADVSAYTAGLSDGSQYSFPIERMQSKQSGVSSSPITTIGTEAEMAHNFLEISPKWLVDAMVFIHDGYNVPANPLFTDTLSVLMNLSAVKAWDAINPFESSISMYERLSEEFTDNEIDNILVGRKIDRTDKMSPYQEYQLKTFKDSIADVAIARNRPNPSVNGVTTNAMNGADIPVSIDKDGNSNVVPLLRAILLRDHLGINIDIKKYAVSGAITNEPIPDNLRELLESGKLRDDVIAQYNEEQKLPEGLEISEALEVINTTELKQITKDNFLEDFKERVRKEDTPEARAYLVDIKKIMEHPMFESMHVLEGTADQLRAYGNDHVAYNLKGDSEIHARYIPSTNEVLLRTDSNTDSQLREYYHELMHVVTARSVEAGVYDKFDGMGLSNNQQKAVKLIVESYTEQLGMLKEFMQNNSNNLSDDARHFYDRYLGNPDALTNPDNLYLAISEYIAFGTLSDGVRNLLDHATIKNLSKTGKSSFQKIYTLFGSSLKKLRGVILNILGLKDFKTQLTGTQQFDFNREALIRIASDISKTNPDNNPAPPKGGRKKLKDISPTSEAGSNIQMGLFDSSSPLGATALTEAQQEAVKRGIVSTNMDVAEATELVTPEQRIEAEAIAYTMEYSKKADPILYSRVVEVYEELRKNFKKSDLTPSNPTARDLAVADIQYDYLTSLPNNPIGLAIFAGVASTSPKIQEMLSNIHYGGETFKGKSVQEAYNLAMNNITTALYERTLDIRNGSKSADAHLKGLVSKIDTISNKRDNLIETSLTSLSNYVSQGNDMLVDKMEVLGTKAFNATGNLRRSNNTMTRWAGYVAGAPALLFSDKSTTNTMMNGIQQFISGEKVPRALREFTTDIVGRSEATGKIYDMIKTVKSKIQAFRQSYREEVPKVLLEPYSKNLKPKDREHISEALINTDMSSLLGIGDISQIIDVVSNNGARNKLINTLESNILSHVGNPSVSNTILRKSKELADFMVNKKMANNLLTNAHKIANLNGEGIYVPDSEAILRDVDALVSLYAFNNLSLDSKNAIKRIVSENMEGIEHTLKYHYGISSAEVNSRQSTDLSLNNRMKGYVPLTNTKPTTIEEIDSTELPKYLKMGYVELDTSNGKSYVMIDIRTKGVFHQGIIQTVRPTIGGADAFSGMLTGYSFGDLITNSNEVSRLTNQMKNNNVGSTQYLPIYRNLGDNVPYAFQKIPPKKVTDMLSPEMDFSKNLANYTGRKLEESMARESNNALVDALDEMYNNASIASKHRDYVNILDVEALSNDPVLRDAVRLIPPSMRRYIRNRGKNELFVRRDLLNDVTGYRMAMVGDFWTGNNRFKKEFQESAVKVIEAIGGKGAFRKFMKAQTAIQSVASDIRDIIVIRSMAVPIVNILSNMAQLVARGVSPLDIVSGYVTKTKEITRYLEVQKRIRALEAERMVVYNNKAKLKDIQARIGMLENSLSKLSITPLIEAGEYSSIADAEIDKNDLGIINGGVLNYVENKFDKLPKGLSTVAKYSIMSRDTTLYDVMKKATDYGDFISKSIFYDKQLKRGVSKRDAMAMVREEFVNYDKLQGRTRHTLENLGLAWFWNWKLRATKTAVSIIKNNPLNALIYSFSPVSSGSIGTPLEESFLSRMFNDKSLTYSLGPEMALNHWNDVPINWMFK